MVGTQGISVFWKDDFGGPLKAVMGRGECVSLGIS